MKKYDFEVLAGDDRIVFFDSHELPYIPRRSDLIMGLYSEKYRVLEVQVEYLTHADRVSFTIYVEKV